MPYVLVRHGVEDYAKWKPFFDDDAANREKHGSRGGRLFRSQQDPNDLVVLMDYEDAQRAMEFAESPDLRETMEKAGVKGKPEILFLEQIEEFRR